MRLNYNKLKAYFEEKYSSCQTSDKKYYYNENGKIIATSNNKIITTFYEEEENHNIYAVSVIKKMYVGKAEDKKVIDAMYIQPISGLYKGIEIENNFAIKTNKYEKPGMQKEISTIGTVKREKNGKRVFENDDFQIEVDKREYVKRDFFNLDGVYILNLQTQYKTSKLNYNEVEEYYQNRNKWLYSDKSIPGREKSRQFILKRNMQSYDGLMRPVIKRIK